MARAGFYPIQSSTIRFGRDGRWYADGQPIDNQRIADLFSRHVRRAPDGSYHLQIAEERQRIEVEDTPWVVVSASFDDHGGQAWIELNDHSVERLDLDSLRVGPGDVLYCRVKGGAEPARFLRAAYYQLAQYISEAEPGRFVFHLGGEAHPLDVL